MSYLMIVDDDEDFATAAATVLRDTGHEVKIELDIGNAEKSMNKRQPDIIILDVMFPENNSAGFELARKMKHHNGKLKNIPVLMLTAVNEKFPLGFSSTDIDGYWLPVEDFLEKPVDLDLLSNKVSKMLP
ncbi:MAG: response regulator [Candidatus Latescibacteria bacterium]|jgi:DNA-binding response OmpR family regulator|nr:response regulator [Candidatus Latescibacterota bacterium]